MQSSSEPAKGSEIAASVLNLSSHEALDRLELIDNDISQILQCAQDTVSELEKIPHSDFVKLQAISEQYFEKCEKVRTELKHNAIHIQPYSPYGVGNYDLKKSVELAEAQQRLNNDECR